MANDNLQELLQTGIQAARRGNRVVARRILQQVIEQDANNELAWIWLASVAETTAQRRDYLERVLTINPNNERARQALERLRHTTPAPGRTAVDDQGLRGELLDREALIRTRGRQRRSGGMSPTSFIITAVLALIMIAIGLVMLWVETRPEDNDPTGTAGAVASTPTLTPTITPIGGRERTLSPLRTLEGTWTPSPAPTATDLPTTTPTLPPLNTYSLLVARERRGQVAWELVSLRADGAGVQPIIVTLSADDEAAGLSLDSVFDAAYSPDGSQFVFVGQVSSRDGQFAALFVAPVEGGTAQRITNQRPADIESPSWSPDGDFIAFASNADGDFDIYIVSAEGGTATALTNNTGMDRQPAWSPTDNIIAFASDMETPGELEIYQIPAAGDGEPKRLTYSINANDSPAWTADGERIVFISTRNGERDLYTMNADGTNNRAVIVRDADGTNEFDPAWSPDGEWIAFVSNRESVGLEVLELFIIRPNGDELQRLMTGPVGFPTWKPQ